MIQGIIGIIIAAVLLNRALHYLRADSRFKKWAMGGVFLALGSILGVLGAALIVVNAGVPGSQTVNKLGVGLICKVGGEKAGGILIRRGNAFSQIGGTFSAIGEGLVVIREFIDLGAEGDFAAAHQLTSAINTEELRGLIIGNPQVFKDYENVELLISLGRLGEKTFCSPPMSSMSVKVTYDDGSEGKISVSLRKEDGSWLIAKFEPYGQ